MQAISLADAEQEWRTLKLRRDSEITPEDLGRIMICAFVLYTPVKGQSAPSGVIEEFFIKWLSDAPEEVRAVLHPEQQLGRICLREGTELVLGPQAFGMVGRLNPDYTDLHIKLSVVDALVSLAQYEKNYPDVVNWIVNKLRHPLGSE